MSSLRNRPGVQSNTCPPTHQTLPVADGRADTAELCLTCLLHSLASETPSALCTLTDLQRQAESLLAALTQLCPSVEAHASSKDVLRRWAWETLNPSGDGPLGESTHRDASGRQNFCVGRAVADILNAVFYRLVHHGDAVRLTQNDSGRACGAAFVDLVVFVFAAWELLLRAPGEASSLASKAAAVSTHVDGLPTQSRRGISNEQSLPRRSSSTEWGYGDPTLTSTYPGEPSDAARYTSQYTALPQNRPQSMEEEGEETARYVSQASSAAVEAIASGVVARMAEDVLRLHPTMSPSLPSSQDMFSLPETPCHRSYTAVSLLYRLACQSPLFTRLLCYTDQFCTLVREMLPLYAARCIRTPTLQSRKREREAEPTHDVAPPDVLHLLLHVIHRAVTGAAPNIAYQRDPLATHFVAPSATSSSDGRRSDMMAQDASLLSSLLMLLETTAFPRVTAAALVLLTEVFTWAATRAQLLSGFRGNGHDTRQEADEQNEDVRGETELLGESPIAARSGGTTAAVAPALRPRHFALLLGPLLLHQNGEVVRLACAALLSLLAPSATRGPAITFSAAQHAASMEVAQEVEGYAAEALDACVRGRPDFCEAVVDVMERVAAVLCDAEETVIHEQHVESPGRGDDDDAAAHSEGWQQQWRVIFRVASVDARLFDRLLCGPVLRRSIRMPVAAVAEQGGADWNCVVSAAVQCVTDAVSLSLHALLRLLDALAAGMGPAMCAVWPEGLNRLVDTLTERLEEQRHAAATASTSGDENALLHHALEPRTHLLLVHVTAAYLPHTGTALHRVALLLLRDLVHGRELAAARCPERMLRNDLLRLPVIVGGTEDAEERECRCLLSIAAHLLEAHNTLLVNASWSSLTSGGGAAGSTQDKTSCPCCAADRGPRRDCQLASLHELCAPQQQQQQSSVHVDSLLDVLLSLHPESPALIDARARLVRALFHDTAPPSTYTPAFVRERHSAHVRDPLPLVGVASLTDLVGACAMPFDAAGLLLALSTWMSVPCVASDTVALLATGALNLLWREVSEATQRLSDAVVTATAAAPEEVSWWPSSHAVGERVACALQCYLALLLVYLRWYGSLPWSLPTPRPPRTANSAVQHCLAASADGEESTGSVAQALLLYMEESPIVRREVAWFWFFVASHYQVDVHGALTAPCHERDDQSPPSASYESSAASALAQQLLFSHLAAVTMLSALVYVSELKAERTTEEDGDAAVEASPSAELAITASHMLSFLETIASCHCLADVFLSACAQANVQAAAATPATASSADRRGMRPAALPLRTAPFAGQLLLAALLGDTAVTALRERASAMCVEGRLRYVLAELVYLVQLRDDSRNRRAGPRGGVEAAAHSTATTTAATHLLVQCLLSQHLTPLLRGSLQTATPSIYVCAADATTATLLRLTSLSLWCVGSSELSECDAVLTQYALRFVRLCRGLSTAEVHRSYAAAEAWENESAEADDVDSETGAVAGDGEEDAECGGERCVVGLPCLSFLVLQLLYLLLQRSNRLAVAAADTAAVLLFTAAAKAVTASAAAREKRGCVDVHVLAAIVEHCLHRLRRQKKSTPWYEQLDGRTYFRRITRLASSAPLRSRVEVLLAGAECLLRLCPPNPPRWYEHPRDWLACVNGKRGPDISSDEWQAICVVIRHCLEALTALLCTNVFALDHSGAVVGRLLFWLLSYYHWMMPYPVDMDLLLATFCCEGLWEEANVEPTRQQLLAEGWLLAGLLNVLSLEPHWLLHHSGLKWRLRRFLARPAVAQKVRQFQHAQHLRILSAAGGEGGAGDGGGHNDNDNDAELCLLVSVLLHAIDGDEERAAGRRNSSAPPAVPVLPAGFVNKELAALQMWVPYTVPTTLPNGNDCVPLLLILHEML